jgi:exopolysaccharide production protein ExoZ
MTHYRSIHYLRAIAAVMVVWFHVHHSIAELRLFGTSYGWMRHGVDIFFVISGFVMMSSTIGIAGSRGNGGVFFARRCQRIVPLYWSMTLVTMCLKNWNWPFVATSLLFVPVFHPADGTFEPLLPPGWTLNYEMFFYLIFGTSLGLPAKWRLLFMGAAFAGLVMLWQFAAYESPLAFYGNPIILEFLLGAIIARYRVRAPAFLLPFGFILLAFDVPILLNDLDFGPMIFSATIVAGALSCEQRLPRSKLFDLLGDSSYAIYLSHLIAIACLLLVTPKIGLHGTTLAMLCATVALVTGVIVHFWLERPINALIKSEPRSNESGYWPTRRFQF